MNLISYEDLAQMRLGKFLESPAELEIEESGMTIIVGLGGYEKLGETSFGWNQGEPFKTAEVTLDLGPASQLPEESARRILQNLRVPVRKGMTTDQLTAALGTPEFDSRGRPGTRLLRFTCGEEGELYYIGCVVDDGEGLVHVFMARKDYCDEAKSI